MKYLLLLMLSISGSITHLLFCQSTPTNVVEPPDIIPPSPEAAAFAKYGEIPVSMYTGSANVSIPLISIQYKDVPLSLNLSYHGSGIKVSDEASSVGLGWVLNSHGVISRNIRGRDDFETSVAQSYSSDPTFPDLEHFPYNNELGNAPRGLYSLLLLDVCLATNGQIDLPNTEASDGSGENINLCDHLNQLNEMDFEPDLFNFNYPGGSGEFILDRSGKAVLKNRTDIQIEYFSSSNKWEITTENGYKYVFDEYETLTRDNGEVKNSDTAWYLKEIRSPSKNTISFYYIKETQNTVRSIINPWETLVNNVSAPEKYSIGGTPQREYTKVKLSYIDFHHGQIQFTYGARDDLENGERIDRIDLYYKDGTGQLNSIAHKSYVFSYEYFVGTESAIFYPDYSPTYNDNYLQKRLKLTKVYELGENETIQNASKNPYQFFYYENNISTEIPSKISAAQDYWGYFNNRKDNTTLIPSYTGPVISEIIDTYSDEPYSNASTYYNYTYTFYTYNNSLTGADREVNPNTSHLFSLEKIIYPTKGETEFMYESHDYDLEKSEVNHHSPYSGINTVNPNNVQTNSINMSLLKPNVSNGQIVENIIELDLSEAYLTPGETTFTLELVTDLICENGNCSNFFTTNTSDIQFQIFTDANCTNPVPYSYIDLGYIQTACSNITPDCGIASTGNGDICSYCNSIIQLTPGVYYFKSSITKSSSLQNFRMYIQYSYLYDAGISNAQDPDNTPRYYSGGIRIKEIISNPLNGSPAISKKYYYGEEVDTDNDGNTEYYSFGKRLAKPTFESYTFGDIGSNNIGLKFMRSSNSTISLGGISTGYSKVVEISGPSSSIDDAPNGKTEYKYINEPDLIFTYGIFNETQTLFNFPTVEADMRIGGLPNLSFTSRNGLLKEQTDYLFTGSLFTPISRTINDYELNAISDFDQLWPLAFTSPFNSDPDNDFDPINNNRLIFGIRRVGYTFGLTNLNDQMDFFFYYPAIYSEWPKLVSTKSITFSSLDSTQRVERVVDYYYDNSDKHLLITKMTTANSDGRIRETQYVYPQDPSAVNTFNSNSILQELIAQNMINTVLEEKVSEGTNSAIYQTSGKVNIYNDIGSGILKPTQIRLYETNDPTVNGTYVPRISFDYDSFANLIEHAQDQGIPTAYLWGYDQSLPVAQVIGVDFTTASSQVNIDILNNPSSELALRNELDKLRDLSDVLVTTYTYNNELNVSSITDPSGTTTYFEYDELGRLINTRDFDNNLLQKVQYNHAN